MKEVNATKVKNVFGQYLIESQKNPIVINKSGKKIAVLTSYDEYIRLKAIEDYYWGELAKKAEEEGFLTVEESEKFISEKLKK